MHYLASFTVSLNNDILLLRQLKAHGIDFNVNVSILSLCETTNVELMFFRCSSGT